MQARPPLAASQLQGQARRADSQGVTFVLASNGLVTKHNPMQHGRDKRLTALLGRHVLEQIVASSAEAVVLLDAQHPERPIIYANPAYEELTGYCTDELIGRSWPLLGRDSVAEPELERLRVAVERGQACSVNLTGLRKDGAPWSGEVSLRPLCTPRGDPEYLLCQHRPAAAGSEPDTSRIEVALLQRELGQARRRIASLDKTDSVTGLLRYEHFMTLLAHDLGIARRERHPLSVLAFEIVELDVYRKTFGAKAADSCLRMIGAQLAGTFRRAGDSCTRCGEDVVVAAVVGQEREQAAVLGERVAGKVRGLSLHNPRARAGRQLWVRHVAVGAEPAVDDAKALVERARSALTAAVVPAVAPPAETRSAG